MSENGETKSGPEEGQGVKIPLVIKKRMSYFEKPMTLARGVQPLTADHRNVATARRSAAAFPVHHFAPRDDDDNDDERAECERAALSIHSPKVRKNTCPL